MSRKDKLTQRLLSFPAVMRFAEVRKILEGQGYTLRATKGSHNIFTKAGAPRIEVPTVNGRDVKIEYLKKIADLLQLTGGE